MRQLLRRIVFYIVALWASVTINFIIPRLAPGNPALATGFARDSLRMPLPSALSGRAADSAGAAARPTRGFPAPARPRGTTGAVRGLCRTCFCLTSVPALEHRMPGLLLLGTNQGIQRCQNEEIQQECPQSQQLLGVEQEDLGEQDRDEDGPLEPRIGLKR